MYRVNFNIYVRFVLKNTKLRMFYVYMPANFSRGSCKECFIKAFNK